MYARLHERAVLAPVLGPAIAQPEDAGAHVGQTCSVRVERIDSGPAWTLYGIALRLACAEAGAPVAILVSARKGHSTLPGGRRASLPMAAQE
jgi:hypothetical protein